MDSAHIPQIEDVLNCPREIGLMSADSSSIVYAYPQTVCKAYRVIINFSVLINSLQNNGK